MASSSVLSSWLSYSNQEELNRCIQYVADDFDVDVVVTVTANPVLNDHLLRFSVRERRGQDHIMPLEWRLKQFVVRLLQIFASTNKMSVCLNDATSVSFYMSPTPTITVTPDQVIKKTAYSMYLQTPGGPIMQGTFELRVIDNP